MVQPIAPRLQTTCYFTEYCRKLQHNGITILYYNITRCPTLYQTRHFFNNFNTNEDNATKFEADTDTFLFISHTTNVLVFKFRCNIFIGVRIIKEMPGSVASGTPCIILWDHRRVCSP